MVTIRSDVLDGVSSVDYVQIPLQDGFPEESLRDQEFYHE